MTLWGRLKLRLQLLLTYCEVAYCQRVIYKYDGIENTPKDVLAFMRAALIRQYKIATKLRRSTA